jgi:hypothetical protein
MIQHFVFQSVKSKSHSSKLFQPDSRLLQKLSTNLVISAHFIALIKFTEWAFQGQSQNVSTHGLIHIHPTGVPRTITECQQTWIDSYSSNRRSKDNHGMSANMD